MSIEATDRGAVMRRSRVARTIRAARLIVVLRQIAPRTRLLDLVGELADAGARVFEITLDGVDAPEDIAATREHLAPRPGESALVGAGTIRTRLELSAAIDAGASFGASPVFDPAILRAAVEGGLPFMPGAYTPTEADAAWRAGATFIKLFPGSSLGPSHVRELRGPLPEIETIVTGGIDARTAKSFLAAGAVAVGIGTAIIRSTGRQRRTLIRAIAKVALAEEE